ncbi:hypothetical protein BBK14_21590 [Parafrankia soli]|uniref:AAA+ ATPase domain-containing protein n=1 Tax=Parafrankia soli TaxID=2599596 RepID=A0A1S1PSJ1_9ACTN|nr:ATP-binding protein [Parafrankia soli]OHV25728.1 hypothetical protein BBK14_21590 [Parafrankia soli]
MPASRDASLVDLLGRLAVVEERVRAAVAARRAVDSEPDDAFRGLYLSEEQVNALLGRAASGGAWSLGAPTVPAGTPPPADPGSVGPSELSVDVDRAAAVALSRGESLRLRDLARRCGLTGLDVDILLVALAPDLDARFEKLYGYLQDDVTRRRASPGLALELCGRSPLDADARARCTPDGPLVGAGLLIVEDAERPFLSRSLRVPDRVAGYLLGDDRPGAALRVVLADAPDVGGPLVALLARAFRSGQPTGSPGSSGCADPAGSAVSLVYLRAAPGADGLAVAASACRKAGRPFVGLDLAAVAARRRTGAGGAAPGDGAGFGADHADHAGPALDVSGGVSLVVREGIREARLTGAVLIIGPVEALDGDPLAAVVAASSDVGPVPPVRTVVHGRRAWEPGTSGDPSLVVDVAPLGAAELATVWAAELGAEMPAELAAFRLTPRQVRRAVVTARASMVADGAAPMPAARPRLDPVSFPAGTAPGPASGGTAPEPDPIRLASAARQQNATGLERLARRITPAVGWDDLVLPPRTLTTLRHLAGRGAHRGQVLDDWGLRRGGGRGEAIIALFVGESGTGKTMAAEVVAGALGVDLYVIDLSTVVDKYIGETEKNLERIFTGAEGLNAVLFFDEADALFGKRSEVGDARDRYANVEVAYLLQRIESFDGVAILATNLAANLDDAFRRRLSVVAEFARPDVEARLALWRRMLRGVPLAADVDLEFCAKAFELAGGDIRNAAVTAAYLGAANGQVVDMRELVTAIGLEYRKLGRLCLADEFGPYFDLLPR